MNVIVSMVSSHRRLVYHKPGCMYEKKMKIQNRMIIPYMEAKRRNYHSCKYCEGLQGEVRCKKTNWAKQYQVEADYARNTDTLYLRTDIGCWKIFWKEGLGQYLLYHKNKYDKSMSLDQVVHGDYHRQRDVKPTLSIDKLLVYVKDHDRAKQIILKDYRNLPKRTAKQKKYYRRAERKSMRRERIFADKRIDDLFANIEMENPEMKKLALC